MIINILIILVLLFILEEIVFEFNSDLNELKKYKPKINIIIINGLIILAATVVFFMTQNKYDIDRNGAFDFDDIVALRAHLMEVENKDLKRMKTVLQSSFSFFLYYFF